MLNKCDAMGKYNVLTTPGVISVRRSAPSGLFGPPVLNYVVLARRLYETSLLLHFITPSGDFSGRLSAQSVYSFCILFLENVSSTTGQNMVSVIVLPFSPPTRILVDTELNGHSRFFLPKLPPSAFSFHRSRYLPLGPSTYR